MRFHVVGLGSIGTLIAHHLRTTVRLRQQAGFLQPPDRNPLPAEVAAGLPKKPKDVSITLHLRREHTAKFFTGTHVEHAGINEVEKGFRIEIGSSGQAVVAPRQFMSSMQYAQVGGKASILPPPAEGKVPLGPSIVQRLGYANRSDAIDSLIVTTKADATVQAIAPLCDRLTPASTIVLLHNGMGVLEELTQRVFPNAASRPQIVLGNMTHGCYSTGLCKTIHAGYGSIRLGIVADPRNRATYEQKRDAAGRPRTGAWRSLLPKSQSDKGLPMNNLSGLDFDAIPTSGPYLTLRHTLATLLSLPLDVHWDPYDAYQISALRKLVVNCCINPLTAIMDCQNGELIHDPHAQGIWSEVCCEASEVFLAAVRGQADGSAAHQVKHGRERRAFSSALPWDHFIGRRQQGGGDDSDPSGAALLDPLLTPSSLLSLTREVATQTRFNYSSMYSDIRGSPHPNKTREKGQPLASSDANTPEWTDPRKRTEIEYMNGYIARLGKIFGIPTKVNDMLRMLILGLGYGEKGYSARKKWMRGRT